MPTFGFSAYLRLISLSPKRQRSEIKSRLGPSKAGYDFHRSLRLRANAFLAGGSSFDEVIKSVETIGRAPERRSAKEGLTKLKKWREANDGELITYSPVLYESPTGIFKVSFVSDFGVVLEKDLTAVHIWNTASPDLTTRSVYAALSILPDLYEDHDKAPADLAVLSLRDSQLYRLSEAPDHSGVALAINNALEEIFQDVREELGLSKGDSKDSPPPPAP